MAEQNRPEANHYESGMANQPLCVSEIGFAIGSLLDLTSVHDQSLIPLFLQCGIRTLPLDPGTLHHNLLRLERCNPLRHRFVLPFETPKLL
uniref:Uncharacterized protein n=1 Tax=Candidatus Kentrum sp. TC TaxID=2126339 RepID=A0A450YSQ4_9GAMM|nr:MAG: hypothetical protein BECKTC1821E_GA0114239_10378 [Candidatus Kentron sp. TC]